MVVNTGLNSIKRSPPHFKALFSGMTKPLEEMKFEAVNQRANKGECND